jgi:hypothetical protein
MHLMQLGQEYLTLLLVCREKEWFMAVGDVKGVIVQTAISSMSQPPKVRLQQVLECPMPAIWP